MAVATTASVDQRARTLHEQSADDGTGAKTAEQKAVSERAVACALCQDGQQRKDRTREKHHDAAAREQRSALELSSSGEGRMNTNGSNLNGAA
jgi:hypothetical protein